MVATVNNILVFKTNIQTALDKSRIQDALNSTEAIQQWNIDQHDVDCVLRIVSDSFTPAQIISIVHHHGFECSELE